MRSATSGFAVTSVKRPLALPVVTSTAAAPLTPRTTLAFELEECQRPSTRWSCVFVALGLDFAGGAASGSGCVQLGAIGIGAWLGAGPGGGGSEGLGSRPGCSDFGTGVGAF